MKKFSSKVKEQALPIFNQIRFLQNKDLLLKLLITNIYKFKLTWDLSN